VNVFIYHQKLILLPLLLLLPVLCFVYPLFRSGWLLKGLSGNFLGLTGQYVLCSSCLAINSDMALKGTA